MTRGTARNPLRLPRIRTRNEKPAGADSYLSAPTPRVLWYPLGLTALLLERRTGHEVFAIGGSREE